MDTRNSLGKNTLLTEISWEVCNQVGGIYTVIRSKVPTVKKKWGKRYLLLGPYMPHNINVIFDETEPDESLIGKAVKKMTEMGLEVHYGKWMVSGTPTTVLFNIHSVMHTLDNIKYFYYQNHHIDFKQHDALIDQVLAFGQMVKIFLSELTRICIEENVSLIAHFHEWMGGSAIPDLRREQIPLKIIFTTHATLLGRYLAMNNPNFYEHLPFIDWEQEAHNFNVAPTVQLERACAHGSHVFTTVSNITAKECQYILGRSVDKITPNGLNIERFNVTHEVQNVHYQYKQQIDQFIMGHFFPSYSFNLDKTLFFFTSGRFEYKNKGYDLVLEALARLNWKLQQTNANINIVVFIITKQPTHSISPHVLNAHAMLDEIKKNCNSILNQMKDNLLRYATSRQDSRLPLLNDMIDDYWKLRYLRTIHSWKSDQLPSIVTHNLVDDNNDMILNFLRNANLINKKEDKVKVIYHPDFITSTNPLFSIEYGDFVRGCHLGIFPSYYEPWGYTPIECLASGVPTVTSDLAGFGDYVKNVPKGDENHGLFILKRFGLDFNKSADHLTNILFRFALSTRKERIFMRNKSEDLSESFDWKKLYKYYMEAYKIALYEIN